MCFGSETFSAPFGLYSFKCLPFGLNMSAELFQRYLSENFKDIEGVNIYIDDLLIFAITVESFEKSKTVEY